MTKIDIYNIQGKKTGQLALPKEIFAGKVNASLMSQAVRVFLANQRRSSAKAKSRNEMTSISTAKTWRQKGTGRARHGSRRAPIFVGGGKAHGPTGKQNYKLKLSKKMKHQALISALTVKCQESSILAITGLSKLEGKTKPAFQVLKAVLGEKSNDRLCVILPKMMPKIKRALSNLPKVSLRLATDLNTYEMLRSGQLIFTRQSLLKLEEYLLKKDKA